MFAGFVSGSVDWGEVVIGTVVVVVTSFLRVVLMMTELMKSSVNGAVNLELMIPGRSGNPQNDWTAGYKRMQMKSFNLLINLMFFPDT